jgi:hypothetical protein
VFAPPNPGTGPQIAAASDVWRELKPQFQLCQATEKALIAQLVDSIDPICLRAMLNRATGQHSGSIRAVILHLFSAHGKITPQQVKAKERELHQMHYDISQPVDTIFNSIDDLSDVSENMNSPMTEQQMIDLACVIFAKQSILQPDLRLWNRRPVAERTHANLTQHLRKAQTDLSSLPTAGDVCHRPPAHQANMATIADLVLQRLLDEQGAELPPHIEPPPPSKPPPAAPVTDVANSLQRRESDLLQSREATMRTQMQDMMASMLRNNGNNNNNNNNDCRRNRNNDRNNNGNNCGNNNGNNDGNNNGNNGDNNRNNNNCSNGNGGNNGNNNRSQQRLYCHTHGCCAHDSPNCSTPGTSHNTAATFANMLNGSTKNSCHWLNN